VRQVVAGARWACKTYHYTDTEKFKCWGSGARNEEVARILLGEAVPIIGATWDDEEAEHVLIEWIDAEPLDPAVATRNQFIMAGKVLGRIHSHGNSYWGALDGSFRFENPTDALRSRIGASVRLLAATDPALADALTRWSDQQLSRVAWNERPSLIHGDFGVRNLLCSGVDHLYVIDWEHARWGDPLEDWAMMRFSLAFPTPNSFGSRQNLCQVKTGWRETAGRPLPRDDALEKLLYAYYAACLGVFFAKSQNSRLRWLRLFLEEHGGP
jgi:aminoglycoside phosphotransferase (APT) family kinase protein